MKRVHQSILLLSTLVGSWLGMQAVHEMGHVLGAWFTGGEVSRVILYPLTISRTDLASNPHPLVVVWAGPVFGVLMPLLFWGGAVSGKLRLAFLCRFFAGFCLIANGAYIAFGSFDGIGDCGVMLRNGSSSWQLWLFGALTIPLGFWLWHRQGPRFGLVNGNKAIGSKTAYLVLIFVLAALTLEFAFSNR